MFVLRSLFWLATVVLLLPPSADSSAPAPRVSLLHTAYAARVLLEDVSGVCQRHPEACATSREALILLTQKLETGADIVSAGIKASQSESEGDSEATPKAGWDLGTLSSADLDAAWALANAAN